MLAHFWHHRLAKLRSVAITDSGAMPATLSHDEILRPIAKVAERRTGKRPSPATTHRWRLKGVRGVKLNAVLLGGSWLCTEQDFDRFIEEQTAAALAPSAPQTATDDELRAAGLL